MKKIILLITTTLLLAGCANVSNPTGGSRDLDPPELLYKESIPDSDHLTNFNGNEIIIAVRDTNGVTIQGLNRELKTNPSLTKPVEHSIKKVGRFTYHISIKLKEELKNNTTYTFNFGNSIRDLSEGNILKSPVFVFSTGEYIDSLKINGSIKNTEEKTQANILVGLYDINDTIKPSIHKPIYTTYSNKTGDFSFTNLAANNYKIIAFDDKNKNSLLNLPKERIAYQKKHINPSQDKKKIDLVLFKQEENIFKMKSIQYKYNHTQLKLSKGIKTVIKFKNEKINYSLSENNKVLSFYPKLGVSEENISFIIKDSLNHIIDTNITLKFTLNERLIKSKKTLITNIETSDNQYFNDSLSFKIHLNTPIHSLVEDNILSISGLDTALLKNRAELKYEIERNKRVITFTAKSNFKDSIKIFIKKGAFINNQGNSNQNENLIFTSYQAKKYSLLKGNIITKESHYIFQLYKGNKLIDQKINPISFNYPILKPGDYKIKILIDKNGNGKYDKGNYYKHIIPEPIYNYPKPIRLKGNWENELHIKF